MMEGKLPLLAVLIDADNISPKWADEIFTEIASFGVTTPVTASAHRTSNATRSIRSTSLTNRTSATARMIRTMAISRFTETSAWFHIVAVR